MKKILILLIVLFALSACDFFVKNSDSATPKEPKKDLVLGGDKDKDGCLSSAGYTWSKLNKECVRAFSGIQLLPIVTTDDETLCAYVLFSESGDQAELFLPNVDESLILERKGKNLPWTNTEYQLIPVNGYQLKKSGKLVFSGDGEIGNKISGSLDSEELPIED
jgi:hypothetical protein